MKIGKRIRNCFFAAILVILGVGFVHAQDASSIQQEKEKAAFQKAKTKYLLTQANAHRQQGDINKAIASLTMAIEQDPTFAAAYYNRAIDYGRQKKFDEALLDLDKAISLSTDPRMKALALYNKGLTLGYKNDIDGALVNYNSALEIDPSYPPAYKNRAVIYFDKKDYENSWKDVHRSEELGLRCNPVFIEKLQEASGRKE